MEDTYIKGTPPMAMLPAKNYIFKMNGGYIEIRIPRRGNYHDLDPEFFPEDAGEFNIFNEEDKVLHLHTITKVLFAIKKYPDMKFNQFLVPHSFTFEEDCVILTGQIMDMMVTKPKTDGV
jgi:hypothetical protein